MGIANRAMFKMLWSVPICDNAEAFASAIRND